MSDAPPDYAFIQRLALEATAKQLVEMLTGAQPHLTPKARRKAAIAAAHSLLAAAQALPKE